MANNNRRVQRRQRHLNKSQSAGGRGAGKARQGGQDFATAGEERGRVAGKDPSRDPKTLSDFEAGYGLTQGSEEQVKGGAATVNREDYGRGGQAERVPERSGQDHNEMGSGKEYGQGFGVGSGHGLEEGSTPVRGDTVGNSGTTFGGPAAAGT